MNVKPSFAIIYTIGEIVVRPEAVNDVTAGTSALLACVASGHPLPSITWNAIGETINETEISIYTEILMQGGLTFIKSVLEICSVGKNSVTNYQCTAESSASNDTFQFELLVATLGGKVACNGFTNVNMYIYTLNAPNNCCSLCIIVSS